MSFIDDDLDEGEIGRKNQWLFDESCVEQDVFFGREVASWNRAARMTDS